MSKLRRLAGETLIYGVGTFVPRMMNFLLVPLHTRIFDPAQYGTITQLYAFVAFLNIVYTFGMETAYFRYATKPGADKERVFNICQTTVVGISVILSALFIIFSRPLATAVGLGARSQDLVWLSVVMLIDASVAIPFARLRLEKKATKFAGAKITNVVILLGLNLLFLLYLYKPSVGVTYVFIANLAANLFYVFFFLPTLFRWRPALDRGVFRAMFVYAYPVMLTGLAGMTNEMFSRITLEWWLPDNFYPGQTAGYALGVFGACYKYAVFMNLAVQAFRFAAEPFFFSNADDAQSSKLFASLNHYFIIACCFILLAVGINLDLLKYILGSKEYWDGLHIVPMLLLGYLFLGVYYNFSVWFKLTDRTYYGTIITVGGAVLTIVLNYILIPVAGYEGSTIATAVCYFLMAAACYVMGQRIYPIPYRLLTGAAYVGVTMALVYGINSLTLAKSWALTLHGAVIAAFVVFVLRSERRQLRQWSEASTGPTRNP